MSHFSTMLRALWLLLMLGSIAGLLTGMALVLRPDWLLRVSGHANRWVSTRRFERALEQVVKLDRWLYRHNRASGTLVLAGAVFIIYFFTAGFDRPGILYGLSQTFPSPSALIEWLLDTIVLASLLGAVFVLIVSLFLLFRPSLLRGFEQGANQWLSLRRALKPFEVPRSGVDEYVFRNIQLSGVLLLFANLYTLAWLIICLG